MSLSADEVTPSEESSDRQTPKPTMIPTTIVPEGVAIPDVVPKSIEGSTDLPVDLFISHAWEDKEQMVRPLVERLRRLGLTIWYDEFSLTVGDSISRSIDKGLAECRFGVIVLSESFMSKPWPDYELRGLTTREIGFGKVILPIWHGVNREDIVRFSPTLADKLALNTATMSTVEIALRILSVARPQSYERLARELAYRELLKSQPVVWKPVEELIADTPIVHEVLPEIFLRRLRLVYEILKLVFDIPWKVAIDNFRKDHDPEHELEIWERIASVFVLTVNRYELGDAERKTLFQHLLGWSLLLPSREELVAASAPDWLLASFDDYSTPVNADKE
jgi:hypothetical protein